MHIKTNPFGVLGGIQLGYNYVVTPNWLTGVEAELSWTTGQGKADFFNNVTAADLYSSHKWYDTLTGRFGHTDGPLLIYAKAGGAWMNADYKLQATSGCFTTASGPPCTTMTGVNGSVVLSPDRVGWTAGTGLEYLLGPQWSAKLEYAFLDFGTKTIGTGALVPGNYIRVDTKEHEVKAGVNYHWGS